MFSKELQELDRNTVQYMIDEMQETIDRQKAELEAEKIAHEQELEAEKIAHKQELEQALEKIKQLERSMIDRT